MSTLANQLAAAEREEVTRAVRLLLARPLLTEASDPAGFELVRRRREPLAQWFDYTCGWSLVVEPRRGLRPPRQGPRRPGRLPPGPQGAFGPGPLRPPALRAAVRDRGRTAVDADDDHRHARRPGRPGHGADRALPAFDPVHRAGADGVRRRAEAAGVVRRAARRGRGDRGVRRRPRRRRSSTAWTPRC